MTQLAGSVVWITGASSGIGEALAILSSQRGAKLVLSARRQAELERVRAACADPKNVAVLPLDLTDLDAERAATNAAGFFGPIDILVNNAGISQRGRLKDTGMAVYRRILELDFFAPVALTKAVLPSMIERRRGHLVVVSSVVGKFGAPLRTGYSAAKHALQGFFDAARSEVWHDGIQVTLICPGYVRTNVSINAITADGGAHGRMDKGQSGGISAERCAAAIVRAIETDREEVLVGAREALFVQFKRFAPGLFSAVLKRVKAD